MQAISRVDAEGFDYMAEADRTCSIEWNPQNVNAEDFVALLQLFAETGQRLNAYKKLFFRGKTPADLGMRQPEPHESVQRTCAHIEFDEIDLVHGTLGIATEAGEAAEILIDLLFGKKPDRTNVVEECGDLRWYINRCLRYAKVTDAICERANIDKLHGRGHANGLDIFADANRDLDAEHKRLAAAIDGPVRSREHPGLPLGVHGDEEPPHVERFERHPIGDCEGMDC